MICPKTSTPSLWVGSEEEPKPQPSLKPPEETVVSEEDQKKIEVLIQKRKFLKSNTKEYNNITAQISFWKHRDRVREYQKRNRSVMSERTRIWRKQNPQGRISHSRKNIPQRTAWARANPEKRREISRRYYNNHKPPPKPKKPLSQSWINTYRRNARKTDIQVMLKDRLRATMNRAFRRNWIKKPARTEALLGCTIDEAKAHIELQFSPGMSWSNRASFVIDHHVPICKFDLRDKEEVLLCFNWRNLKPLTQVENSEKSATMPDILPSWLPPHIAARIISRSAQTRPAHHPS